MKNRDNSAFAKILSEDVPRDSENDEVVDVNWYREYFSY